MANLPRPMVGATSVFPTSLRVNDQFVHIRTYAHGGVHTSLCLLRDEPSKSEPYMCSVTQKRRYRVFLRGCRANAAMSCGWELSDITVEVEAGQLVNDTFILLTPKE